MAEPRSPRHSTPPHHPALPPSTHGGGEGHSSSARPRLPSPSGSLDRWAPGTPAGPVPPPQRRTPPGWARGCGLTAPAATSTHVSPQLGPATVDADTVWPPSWGRRPLCPLPRSWCGSASWAPAADTGLARTGSATMTALCSVTLPGQRETGRRDPGPDSGFVNPTLAADSPMCAGPRGHSQRPAPGLTERGREAAEGPTAHRTPHAG